MILMKAIEQYIGEEVDFLNDVILMQDGTHNNKPYIHTWKIAKKKKPSLSDLEKIYDENKLTERELEKLKNKKISLKIRIDAGNAIGEDMSQEEQELQELIND